MSLNICTLTEIGVSLVWPTYSQSRLYVHMKYKEFDVTSLDLSGIYSPTNMSIHVRFHEKRRQRFCVLLVHGWLTDQQHHEQQQRLCTLPPPDHRAHCRQTGRA